MGLTDQVTENQWRWTSDPTVPAAGSIPWSSGEPNNANGNEDCAHLWNAGGTVVSMNDLTCSSLQHFVCKQPAGCGPGQRLVSGQCQSCTIGTYSSTASNSASSCTPCPAGTYGSTTGLKTAACTGKVAAGHYSTASATSATQNKCPAGRFASTTGSTSALCEGPIAAGYFGGQAETTSKPSGKLCKAGRFGGLGQSSDQCSGSCDPGYYCAAGSSSSKASACGGATVYCPAGSSTPQTVRTGYYSKPETGNTRSAEAQCEPGFYCASGQRSQCKATYYGAAAGQTTDECSGACDVAGFLCPAGSTKKTQVECGAGQTHPTGWYCAAGATTRTQVSSGHYSTPLTVLPTQRSGQAACEDGFVCANGGRTAKVAFTGPGQLCTLPDTAAGASPHDYTGELEVAELAVAATLGTIGVASASGSVSYAVSSKHAQAGCGAVAGQSAGSTGHPFHLASTSATSVTIQLKSGVEADFEACGAYTLTLSATSDGTTAKCTIAVAILDRNDQPYFLDQRGSVITTDERTVPEGSSINTLVGLPVIAGDQDAAQELRFSILSGDPDGLFAIGACSGQVHVVTTTASDLDHETNGPTGSQSPHFRLVILVRDDASPTPSQATLTLSVTLTDVPEPPAFDKTAYSLAVDENSPAGTILTPAAGFTATDPDGPAATAALRFSLEALDGDGSGGESPFAIDETTGRVRVAPGAQLNFERVSSIRVVVTVTDGVFSVSLADTITINDVNDPPTFTGKDILNGVVHGVVFENTAAGALVLLPTAAADADDTQTPELAATDEDAADGNVVTWGIEAANTINTPFVITEASVGSRVALSAIAGASGLDFESLRIQAMAGNTSGWLRLDTESDPSVPVFTINVTMTDAAGAMRKVPYHVAVRDVNEAPVLQADGAAGMAQDPSAGAGAASIRREVPENAAPGTPVAVVGSGRAVAAAVASGGLGLAASNLTELAHLAVRTIDVDVGQSLFYSLVPAGQGSPASTTPPDLFDIDRTTGIIRTLQALDREDTSLGGPVYTLRVQVCDNGSPTLCDAAEVRVEVLNVNEAPRIAPAQLLTLVENAAPGSKVTGTALGSPVVATDADAGDAAALAWSIDIAMLDINGSTGTNPLFAVGGATGVVEVAATASTSDIWTSDLSFEDSPRAVANPVLGGASSAPAEAKATGNYFRVSVRACDRGVDGPPLCHAETVVIALTDAAEAPRVIAGQSRAVNEQEPMGTTVGATPLRAEDQDAGQTATLTFRDASSPQSSQFAIAASGSVTLKTAAPDLMGADELAEAVTIVVSDGALDSPPVNVTLSIVSVNFPPTVTAASVAVAENSAIGTLVHTIAASDANSDQTLTFFADAFDPPSAKSLLRVDETTGQILVAGPLNHERLSSITLTVLAQDDGPGKRQGTADITITVSDVPEAPVLLGPSFLVTNETTAAGEGPLPVPPLGTAAGDAASVRLFEPASADPRWSALNAPAGSSPPGYVATGVHWIAADAANQAAANATDEDAGQTATLRFSLAAVSRATLPASQGGGGGYTTEDLTAWGVAQFPLAVDESTGKLAMVGLGIDFERLPSAEPWITARLTVTDSTGLTDTGLIRVWVLDVNERVLATGDAFEISELAGAGQSLSPRSPDSAGMTATDPDGPSLSHARRVWAITAGNEEGRFAIDPTTGLLRLAAQVDWEDRETYTLAVTITDTPAPGGAQTAGGRVLAALSTTVTATVTVLNVEDSRITRVFGSTEHSSRGGDWVYFEGENLGPTARKLDAMRRAQIAGDAVDGGVAGPRQPALANADATDGFAGLWFSATNGPVTGREYSTVQRCERPAGTTNNSLVRCLTGESRGALRWILRVWHVREPTAEETEAAEAAAGAGILGHDEDVWAAGLAGVFDEAITAAEATRTRPPTVTALANAAMVPTQGGTRVRLFVSDAGPLWLGLQSGDVKCLNGDGVLYRPTNCSISIAHEAIDCTTTAGYGSNLAWVVSLDGQQSQVFASGAYELPAIASLNVSTAGAVSGGSAASSTPQGLEGTMSTRGGELVVIRGTGFGPAGTPVSAVYASPSYVAPDTATAAEGGSSIGGPYAGRTCFVETPHTVIHCVTAPGVGSGLLWAITVGIDSGAQTSLRFERTPVSYQRPRVGSTSGAGAFRASTEGGQPLVVSGAFYGPATFGAVSGHRGDAAASLYPPTVHYGPASNPMRYEAANCRVDGDSHGRIVCFTVPGTGHRFVYTVAIAGQLSEQFRPAPPQDELAGYAAPVVSAYLGDGPGSRPRGSTEGGDRVEVQGKNFGPGDTLGRVFYGHLGADEYAGQQCRVLDHKRVQCATDEGAGDQMQWTVIVDGQQSEAPSTAYGAPVIEGFEGVAAANASTLGGEVVDLVGRNFGPTASWSAGRKAGGGDHTFLEWVRYGPTGVEYDAQGCQVLDHTRVRCTTVPGSGAGLVWRTRVQAQTSQPSPAWSYRAPVVRGLTPSVGDSTGLFRVTLVGTDFAVRDNFTRATVTVGDSPRELPVFNGRVLDEGDPIIAAALGTAAASRRRRRSLSSATAPFEALEFVMPPGTGRSLPISLILRMTDPDLGTSAETQASVSIRFRFNQPVIEQVFTRDNSAALAGSVVLFIRGSSFGPSSATGRLRLGYTYVEPLTWTHDVISVVSPVLEGNVHVQVYTGDPSATIDRSEDAPVYASAADTDETASPLANSVANEEDAVWIESNAAVYTQRQPRLGPGMRSFFEPGAGATQTTPGQQELVFEAQNIGADRNLTEVLVGPTQLHWRDVQGVQRDVFPAVRDSRCRLLADPELINATGSDSDGGGQRFRVRCITPAGQGRSLMNLQVQFAGESSLDPSELVSLPYFPPTLADIVDAASPTTSLGEWIVTPVEGVRSGIYHLRLPTRGGTVRLTGANFGLIGYIDSFVTADHPDFNAIMPVQAVPGSFASTVYSHTSADFLIPPGVAHAPIGAGSPAAAITPPGHTSPAPLDVLANGGANTSLFFRVGHPSFEYQTADTHADQGFADEIIVAYHAPAVTAQVHTGSTTGGRILTITGDNFGESVITPPRILVGGRLCQLLDAAGNAWIPGEQRATSELPDPHVAARCILPEGAGRNVPVHVWVGQLSTPAAAALGPSPAVVHYDPPVIHSVWPPHGPTQGGVNFTIVGLNFAGRMGSAIDWLVLEAVRGYDSSANPNSTIVSPSDRSRIIFANHTTIVVTLPEGQGGAKRLRLVVAGQEASTLWSASLPSELSDGVTAPALATSSAAKMVAVFRYDRPVVTKVSGACPTLGCEIEIEGSNFGLPVLRDGSIVPSVFIAPPAVRADLSQDHEPFACLTDPSRPANETHTHSKIACIVPEGMGANLRLTVQAGTQLSDPAQFSYLPPDVQLFLPNAPSALGNVRIRVRGTNLGTSIAPLNITFNDEPCDVPELLSPHTQAVCTARATTVGSKNVSVFVAWQTRDFLSEDRLVAFECPPGYYGQVDEVCLRCPPGAACLGDECLVNEGVLCKEYHEPTSLSGWWRSYASTPTEPGLCPPQRQTRPGKFAGSCPTFVPCEPAAACVGDNVCAPEYTGDRCAQCAKNYFRFNGECAQCPDLPWLAPLLIIVALLVVCISGYLLQRAGELNVGAFIIAIDYLQVLAIYARSRVNWPVSIKFIYQLLSVLNLNLELLNPECLVENITYDLKFIGVLAIPLALAAVFGTLHVFKYLYNLCILRLSREKRNSHLPQLLGALWSLSYVLYLVETTQVFAAFNCSPTSPPDSAPHGYLRAEFVPCYVEGGLHLRLLPYAYAGLVLYVVAFPLAVMTVLCRNSDNIKLDQLLRCHGLGQDQLTSTREVLLVRRVYSRLYAMFRPGTWWFVIPLLCRKAGIAVVALIFRRAASFQLGAILVILLVAYAMQVRFHPWMGPAQFEEERLYHEAKVASGKKTAMRINSRFQEVQARLRRSSGRATMEGQMRRKAALGRRANALAASYDLNRFDQTLLSIAVFVALAGVCFESSFFEEQGLSGYRDFLTGMVLLAIGLSFLYILLLLGSEIMEACCPTTADRFRRRAKASERSAIALAADERKSKMEVTDMAYNPLQKLAAKGDREAMLQTGLDIDEEDSEAMALVLELLRGPTPPTPEQWLVIKGRLDGMKRDIKGLNQEIRLLKRAEANATAKANAMSKGHSTRARQKFAQQKADLESEGLTSGGNDDDEDPLEAEARKDAARRAAIDAASRSSSISRQQAPRAPRRFPLASTGSLAAADASASALSGGRASSRSRFGSPTGGASALRMPAAGPTSSASAAVPAGLGGSAGAGLRLGQSRRTGGAAALRRAARRAKK